jgi:serine/threonine protein phosphatase PrpC
MNGLLDTGWASEAQPRQTLHDALVAAQSAVARLATDEARAVAKPPATTILAALVTPAEAFLAGLGDSRAYWITADGATQLTVDDSWAQEAIDAGLAEPDARRSPYAHAITRWLGATAADTSPVVHAVKLDGPGTLIICTDGLWNSYPHAADLADLIDRTDQTTSALTTARNIVAAALDAGGHDNVTVALMKIPS